VGASFASINHYVTIKTLLTVTFLLTPIRLAPTF
jgi:hypothetical protein